MSKLRLLAVVIIGMVVLSLVASSLPNNVQANTSEHGGRDVKVLIITMFEIGNVTGDFAGESQLWVEGFGLTEKIIDVPHSYSPLYCNKDGVCMIITGVGVANATATVQAIGESGKVDLSRAYILIAGIAGVDPEDATIGSAAWADWVIDGDLAHHIDAREMPATFDYPYFRLGCATPWCAEGSYRETEYYQLNGQLVDWAMFLSDQVALFDTATAQAYRAQYPQAAAQAAPDVYRCDSFSASTYWHGDLLSDWANWWSEQWSNGQANYCMTNQEDSGTLTALERLSRDGDVDFSRIMVLRTAANFDQQHPAITAGQSVRASSGGFVPSVQNAYRVGNVVVRYILDHWNVWKNGVPPLSPDTDGALIEPYDDFESNDYRVTRVGAWTSVSDHRASGDSYLTSSNPADAITFEFDGTKVEVEYLEGPSFGTFAIEIDNVVVRTVVTGDDHMRYNRKARIDHLAPGKHVIRVYPVSGTVAIDAFKAALVIR